MFQWRQSRFFVIAGVLLLVGVAIVNYTLRPTYSIPDAPAIPDTLPAELSDPEFWRMVETFSEPDGEFRSDNLLSNESGLQDVIPKVKERVGPGGVYIGVGPEQNFTYILAFEPKMSFIVDIRRMNMLEHLLYKAIFELSQDRGDVVSLLFSRNRPEGITTAMGPTELFDAFEDIPEDGVLFERNLARILQHLRERHGFGLSDEDTQEIRYILTNFFQAGPNLSYSFRGSYYQGTLGMPSYRELMASTDSEGRNWSFLATEEQFRRIQAIEKKNLIVPLVGDFAGPRALRMVSRYMSAHHALLSVFYTSNVEMYLFQQDDDWKYFYENVSGLPINSSSTFIRFAAGRGRGANFGTGYFSMRSQMWSPVREVLEAVRARKIKDYPGVLDWSE